MPAPLGLAADADVDAKEGGGPSLAFLAASVPFIKP